MAPWADEPFALIPIKSLTSSSPDAKYIASEMAYAHNGLLRALNSIYNQAPYVKLESDIHDLLQYSIFWVDWIEEHHHGEEALFFPAVERISGDKGLMARNIEQHHAFIPGLETFQAYLKGCIDSNNKETFHLEKFMRLIDSFGPALKQHLTDEITTLIGLENLNGGELRKEYDIFDLEMRKGDKAILFPIVMGSSDASFEGEPLWPAVPGFLYYVIHYFFERKYRSVWRFCPSTTWGVRRELAFGPKTA